MVTERSMKSIVVKQRCNECGALFDVEYQDTGSYTYCDPSRVCSCERDFHPENGPTITQWLESVKGEKKMVTRSWKVYGSDGHRQSVLE